MALASFNADFNKQQAELAKREKDKANGWGSAGQRSAGSSSMTADQIAKFQNSKFMQQSAQIDDVVKQMLDDRNRRLMQTDRTWLPADTDFSAPKSFKYDKFVNYYGVLGLQDMATNEEIKAAYKRLSLVYHPDKTAGMTQEKKDEYAGIFIELKNAYMTLVDNPTRRQYDSERTREMVMCEVSGGQMKQRKQFWGFEMQAERQEMQQEKEKAPSQTVTIPLPVRLEKFAWGGHKMIKRMRKVCIRGNWEEREKEHHILVRPAVPEPFETNFREKGDEHEDRMPDTLKYVMTSKPHPVVDRIGSDLKVKKPVGLPKEVHDNPYLKCESAGLQGSYCFVWGRNPFFKQAGTGKAELRVKVYGMGLGDGALTFRAEPSTGGDKMGEKGAVWEVVGGGNTGGILVRLGEDVAAPKADTRLSTGALVKPLRLVGERLSYEKLTGTGPDKGWVSIRLPGKELVKEKGKVWEVQECESPDGVLVNKEEATTSPAEAKRLAKGSLIIQIELKGDRLRYEKLSGSGPDKGWVTSAKGGSSKAASGGSSSAAKAVDTSDISNMAMRKRVMRLAQKEKEASPICEIELAPMSGAIQLYTNPGATMTFYSNLSQSATESRSGFVQPRAMFGVVISSQIGAKKKGAADWDAVRGSLFPVMRETIFKLLPRARNILAKPIANAPIEVPAGGNTDAETIPVPWERLGDEAFSRYEVWTAALYYTRALESLSMPWDESATGLLSKRADCYGFLGHWDASLADASAATVLSPTWSKLWRQVGQAYQKGALAPSDPEDEEGTRKAGTIEQALEAFKKAVELEPFHENMHALYETVCYSSERSMEGAEEYRAKGNEAVANKDHASAIALYTMAIAKMPQASGLEASIVLSTLHCNRSAAFSLMKHWGMAVADGEQAVAACKELPMARCRLGVALMGAGQTEKAYDALCQALKLTDDCTYANQVRSTCMMELVRGVSSAARAREGRFFMDAGRPKGNRRVFALSDIHFDQRGNEEWAHYIDGTKFQEDILIISGGMCDSFDKIIRGLQTFKGKFGRLFYQVGSVELAISPAEKNKFSDSLAKMLAIYEACDAMGIDIGPAQICSDTFLVPLASWYNYHFDAKDPIHDPNVDFDHLCKWPIDRAEQVWKYMLKMNEPRLAKPYHGTVMTFSHVLPRRGLPFWDIGQQIKFLGCTDIDEQLRSINSTLHVYGRSHRRSAKEDDGVTYVHQPLGKPDERHEDSPPLMMVFDGQSTCTKLWNIWDAPA